MYIKRAIEETIIKTSKRFPVMSVTGPRQMGKTTLMQKLDGTFRKGLNEIYTLIFKVSMPELYADKNIDWEIYYRSYVDTYLQRDIRDFAQVAGKRRRDLGSHRKEMAVHSGIFPYRCTGTALL